VVADAEVVDDLAGERLDLRLVDDGRGGCPLVDGGHGGRLLIEMIDTLDGGHAGFLPFSTDPCGPPTRSTVTGGAGTAMSPRS